MTSKWTLLSFLIILILSGCTRISEPEFRRIENFRMKDLGFTQSTIALNVTYFNPNDFSMSVKETGADVYVDGVFIGRFTQDSAINVDKKQEFSIPITGMVPMDKLLQVNLRDLYSRQVNLEATGSTKVGKAGIYITKPFRYEGKHSLNDIR